MDWDPGRKKASGDSQVMREDKRKRTKVRDLQGGKRLKEEKGSG